MITEQSFFVLVDVHNGDNTISSQGCSIVLRLMVQTGQDIPLQKTQLHTDPMKMYDFGIEGDKKRPKQKHYFYKIGDSHCTLNISKDKRCINMVSNLQL